LSVDIKMFMNNKQSSKTTTTSVENTKEPRLRKHFEIRER